MRAKEYLSQVRFLDERITCNGFACILVENYYEGSAISKGSLPETTKHNKKYHGFGLRSVKYTCEKYGGYINTSVRDGWFRLEMIIPKA